MYLLQQRLAQSTRALHQRIEDNPFVRALNDRLPLEPSYRWLLTRLYPFVKGAEACLKTFLARQSEYDVLRRCRLALLENDLALMGITPSPSQNGSFDAIQTPMEALGLLYVLEGSRKGGQFLAPLLQRTEPHLPVSYLLGYGDTTDQEWERFCQLLEGHTVPDEQDQIVSGAVKAFEILERIFHEHR
ncbi:MAG: biliverdin-producing heme oxygenase [Campylobacterales bacterium]|nr:biliverdin-producing heme oxygenase [Campylobacterales bacterium]